MRRVTGGTFIVAIVGASVLAACGKPELSRAKAEELIVSSKQFQELRTTVRLSASGFDEGVKQEIWSNANPPRLSDRGREAFSKVGRSDAALRTPADPPEVQVTGIADAPLPGGPGGSIKEAHFSWTNRGLPPLAKRFFSGGGSGSAYFRLYDDGWRLEDMSLEHASDRAQLSDAEQADELADLQRIEERKAAEALRRAQRTQESKTPTRTLLSFQFCCHEGAWSSGSKATETAMITDVGITFADGCGGQQASIWFGDVVRLEKASAGLSGSHCTWGIRINWGFGGWGGSRRNHALYLPSGVASAPILQAAQTALDEWKARYPELVQR